MKKILMAIMLTASVMLFSGCGRNNDQISTDVKPVVEQIVGKLGVKATCTRLLDIRKVDSDHYTATAEVKYKNGFGLEQTELLNISIAYDGDTVLVKVEK